MSTQREKKMQPGLESMEGRMLTASMAGNFMTQTTAEVGQVANRTGNLKIVLEDILISSTTTVSSPR